MRSPKWVIIFPYMKLFPLALSFIILLKSDTLFLPFHDLQNPVKFIYRKVIHLFSSELNITRHYHINFRRLNRYQHQIIQQYAKGWEIHQGKGKITTNITWMSLVSTGVLFYIYIMHCWHEVSYSVSSL